MILVRNWYPAPAGSWRDALMRTEFNADAETAGLGDSQERLKGNDKAPSPLKARCPSFSASWK